MLPFKLSMLRGSVWNKGQRREVRVDLRVGRRTWVGEDDRMLQTEREA